MNPVVKHHKLFTYLLLIASVLSSFTQFLPARAESNPSPSEPNLVAPANDNFANAQVISGASGNATGTTAGASKEAGEPSHGRNRGGASVWFKYVAPGNGVLTVDTSASGFDTTMAIYRGSALSNLKQIAENDDTLVGITSKVTVGTKLNDTFYIAVDGYYNVNSSSLASGSVQLNYNFGNVVANDNFASATMLSLNAGRMLSTTNVGASLESGEPGPNVAQGGKSLWFKWVAPSGANRSYTFIIESTDISGAGSVGTIYTLFAGTAFNNFDVIQYGLTTNHIEVTFVAIPGQTYYLQLDGRDMGDGAQTGTFNLSWGITRDSRGADFDRDGRTDISVFRPTTGTWYTIDSVTDQLRVVQFGANADRPILGDFGTDGRPDYAVFRPDTGLWYFNDSEAGFKAFAWGIAGDIPLFEHRYNGNSFAIFRPSTGLFCERSYTYSGFCQPWGLAGDVPMYMDNGGNGYEDIVVFRPSHGTWYAKRGSFNTQTTKFGQNGDKPVPADYDGDGRPDIAVFRPSNGTWYILYSGSGSVGGFQWGTAGDIPQPADYDGDGKADLAVFRSGVWYIRQTGTLTMRAVQFGQAGDIPVSAPIY